MVFGVKQFHCQVSCDHELANEGARCSGKNASYITIFIIHRTHCEKSDWSRAFNQFTIACELDMINVLSAADITFIMSSSTSAWLLSPRSVLLRNKMPERFASVSEDELCEKCIIKQLSNSVFA